MATIASGGAAKPASVPVTDLPPITMGTRISYGIGSIAPGLKGVVFNTFLLFYYNQVVGISAAVVSTAIALTLIVDAVADPLIGRWSDVTRTRWGRRHPFMYGAVIPVALCFTLVWFPPAGMGDFSTGVWIFVTAALARASISAFEIAGNAMAPELTDNYRERTRLFSLRYLFGYVGAYGFTALSFATFFRATPAFPRTGQLNPAAYPPFVLTGAAVMVVVILICALGTHNRIPLLRQSSTASGTSALAHVREMLGSLWNRAFFTIFGFGVFKYSAIGLYGVINLFFGTYLWKFGAGQLALLTLAGVAAAVVAWPLAPIAAGRLGKRTSAMLFAILGVALGLSPLLLAHNGLFLLPGDPRLLPTLLVIDVTYGAMVAISLINTSAMLADVVEDSAVRTGRRDSGTFFAASSFMQQCSTAAGVGLAGIILHLSHFPAKPAPGSVTDAMVDNLVMHYVPIVMVLWTVGALILCFYPITKSRHEANIDILRAREAEAVAREADNMPSGSLP